jgi:hypothetical protein
MPGNTQEGPDKFQRDENIVAKVSGRLNFTSPALATSHTGQFDAL